MTPLDARDALNALAHYGVVPTVEISDVATAVPIAEALLAGGLRIVEVTFRTSEAAEAIARIVGSVEGMIVGAGTLISASDVAAAVAAGAAFGVSPGFAEPVATHAGDLGLPFVPGCATATEAMHCLAAGYSLVKLFPSEPLGGVAAAAALLDPLRPRGLRIMATGGLRPTDLESYLRVPGVVACGGSWIAPPSAVAASDWAGITKRAAAAAAVVEHVRRSA